MIGTDQITVPVRIGTVVRDFGPNFIGPVRGPNLIGPKLIGPVRGPSIWSVFSVPVRVGPVRIFSKNYLFGPDQIFGPRIGPEKIRTRGPIIHALKNLAQSPRKMWETLFGLFGSFRKNRSSKSGTSVCSETGWPWQSDVTVTL